MDFDDLDALADLGGNPNKPDFNLLNGLAPDERLFRFMRTDRFLDLVTREVLVLRKPNKWDDPFEDFLSKTRAIVDGQPIGFDLTKGFFGQCWTTREECDGFWRNYCSLNDGVRIETTVGKLIRSIWDSSNRFRHLQRFVGRVEYLAEEELKARYAGCLDYGHELTDQSNRGCAQTLLIKRTEFSYEHEVRVLADDRDTDSDVREFPIRPRDLVDSIMFAPKMHTAQCEALTDWLVKHGFERHAISRSKLYDPWTLILDGTGALAGEGIVRTA